MAGIFMKKEKTKNILLEKAKNNKSEFFDFLKNYNVISLAIGVVLGNAAKELVTALVNDIIMPIIGIISPGGQWREITIPMASSELRVGNLLGSLVDFLIVAVVVFLVVKKLLKIETEKK